jgi:D-3-phosphoglycerate dehydrogenase
MAQNLGKFAGQFFSGAIKSVEITYGGEVSKKKPEALTRTLLKELLESRFEDQLNEVNVLVMAKEKGIKVTETKVEAGDFTTHMGVKVETENGTRQLVAAASGASTQIVDLDGFRVAIPTEGSLIIFFNQDAPGMIGKASTVLGEAGVNIASLTNGRKAKGGEAVTVINVDGDVADSVVGKLNAISGVKNASVIKL